LTAPVGGILLPKALDLGTSISAKVNVSALPIPDTTRFHVCIVFRTNAVFNGTQVLVESDRLPFALALVGEASSVRLSVTVTSATNGPRSTATLGKVAFLFLSFLRHRQDMARTVKVAVIGSGLAGLTAAYLLAQSSSEAEVEFEVHVFEKVRTRESNPHAVCTDVFLVFVFGHGLVLHLTTHPRHKERMENRRAYAFVSRRYVCVCEVQIFS
jgi:hypothetical protein